MKKTIIIITILFGLGIAGYTAPNNGGLFQRGASNEETDYINRSAEPVLPTHGLQTNYDANTPIGSGVAVLIGLGAGYLMGKRRKE